MVFEHRLEKMVEFSHTDMAGIVHFSNFYRFMEAVEHDFFRSLGKSIVGAKSEVGEHLGWPRVQAECAFFLPLKFEDKIQLHLIVRELRNATIRYEVIFSKMHNNQMTEAARGTVTIVHVGVNKDTHEMKARPLPDWIRESISVAPENYLTRIKK
jgi:acyl-CoA thioester hydrolase